jgi:outer membrane receptor protein involved in Fe transport
MRKTIRQRLFTSTMIFGAAALTLASGGYAAAQAPATTPAQPSTGGAPASANPAPAPQAVQEVVVTGSRIRAPNETSDAPITSVSSEEIKLEGTTTIENLLNSLPQVIGGQNLGQSIDSSGTATVSLRNLGPQRTLVLVDGRRLPPGDPTAPYADLNQIPSALVERVDVVTGGASAVYGADAVAGVVNFIMKKDFQGVELDAQASANQNSAHDAGFDALLKANGTPVPGNNFDGEQYTASVIVGVEAPDSKGNITAYGTYFHSDPVLQSSRDYSACGLGSTYSTTSSVYNVHSCIGSSNSAYGRFQALSAASGNTVSPGTTAEIHDNPNGTNTFVSSAVPTYNFDTASYIQREDDRYNFGYFAHYQVNPKMELYSDFMFAEDNTVAQYAPSGFFAGTGAISGQSYFNVNCNNPLLSAQQATALCGTSAGTSALTQVQIGYRFSAADRVGTFNHTAYKADVGIRGDLDNVWSYDAYVQYGTSSFQQAIGGYASLSKLQNALEVNPNGTCYVGGACVPINIFTGLSSSISQAAYNYVLVPAIESGDTVEQVASASLNGDLGKYGLKSPYAQDGIQIALGSEYRRENLLFQTDEELASGDLSGGSQEIGDSGTYQVYELFTEARIPIAQNLPFIKSMNFNPGYRFSDYTSAGITNTYKLDYDYSPVRDVTFRYSYNVAVRAPNIDELYTPTTLSLFSGQDPCAGSNPSATLAACERSGVTAAEYGNISQCPASQCSSLAGGNPDLKPEEAYTDTYGVVLKPRWIPRLFASVDYYNIRIKNVIENGLGGANEEVTGCVDENISSLCSLIHRDPATGEIFGSGYVTSTEVNDGFIQTKGLDFAATYTYPLPKFGRLDFNFDGTYTAHFVTEAYQGSGTYDCAGLYGVTCGVPDPHWRHKLRATWVTPWKVTASIQWRYIGGTKVDVDEPNPLLQAYEGLYDAVDNHISAYNYMDVSVQWKVKDGMTLRAGCSNIMDKAPPAGDENNLGVYGSGNGNTFPQLYDTLGRNLFIGLTADL